MFPSVLPQHLQQHQLCQMCSLLVQACCSHAAAAHPRDRVCAGLSPTRCQSTRPCALWHVVPPVTVSERQERKNSRKCRKGYASQGSQRFTTLQLEKLGVLCRIVHLKRMGFAIPHWKGGHEVRSRRVNIQISLIFFFILRNLTLGALIIYLNIDPFVLWYPLAMSPTG